MGCRPPDPQAYDSMNEHEKDNYWTGFLTYTGGLGVIQAVSLITVAGVTLSCVVTNPLATNIRVDLTLVHLWARRERRVLINSSRFRTRNGPHKNGSHEEAQTNLMKENPKFHVLFLN